MTKDEVLRLALEALERSVATCLDPYSHEQVRSRPEHFINQSITAIKAALEAKDEPVAYINVEQRKLEWAKYISWDTPTVVNLPKIPLYTTLPRRTWVGLTDGVMCDIAIEHGLMGIDWIDFARAIEAKLKEKNT
jgi:hypothetical protein